MWKKEGDGTKKNKTSMQDSPKEDENDQTRQWRKEKMLIFS